MVKNGNLFNKIEFFKTFLEKLEKHKSPIILNNIDQKFIFFIISFIKYELNKKIIFISPDDFFIKELNNILNYDSDINSFILEGEQTHFYKIDAQDRYNEYKNLNTLYKLIQGDFSCLNIKVSALNKKYQPPELFKNNRIEIDVGSEIDIYRLLEKLTRLGYEKTYKIESIGQFSQRGDILDIYSPNYTNPVRIVFFGDEVESIKIFEPNTQISLKEINNVSIIQARLYTYNNFNKEKIDLIKNEFTENLNEDMFYELNMLEQNSYFAGMEKYVDFFYEEKDLSIFNYLSNIDDYVVIIDNPKRLIDRYNNIYDEFFSIYEKSVESGFALKSQVNLIYDLLDIKKVLKKYQMVIASPIFLTQEEIKNYDSYLLNISEVKNYKSNLTILSEDIEDYLKSGNTVIITEYDKSTYNKLYEVFLQKGLNPVLKDCIYNIEDENRLYIVNQKMKYGFNIKDFRLVLITHDNMFSQKKSLKKKMRKLKTKRIKSFLDIKKGDIVVHETYGIGRFISIDKREVKGVIKDFIQISYAKGDKIYVPISQMDKVQRYVGNMETISLSNLSSNKWKNQKAKAKKAAEQIAKYLVDLYADREKIEGYQFSKDTVWQDEFESLFPYEETEDQLAAIEDVKRDMEKKKPMDRLICGDVGYGKTEVAIRAIFKAIMDSKQAAFLVPTTILAEQHYETIIKRFSSYPINVQVLSRFRSQKEQKEILDSLKNGNCDVVIGTHRILSKDVSFKDLGLLVIDEEQRFGVKHKETIKELKKNVDVLTLTATPIPRTLDMALSGIRDMSVLNEPPSDRLPVITFVTEAKQGIIMDAIEKEINRNGQVYFVYNRVESIYKIKDMLKKLVPNAKLQVAHGQMSANTLENIMFDFMNKEYDVLICTTIIETGMDISNVNTIIIYDADRFGLSQLYQLRGRVGRSSTQAYAYLMYRKNKSLSEVVQSRLKAIKEFTEFGSGFKIAMKDLEIRGAGNLLGEKQHGHMQEIGYELYMKMLNKAIKKLQNNEDEKEIITEVQFNSNAYIPDNYIENEIQKMEIYKKISSIENNNDYNQIREEIKDRYSVIPIPVENLLKISYIKSLGEKLGLEKISQKNKMVIFENSVDKSVQRFSFKNEEQLLDKTIDFLQMLI